MRVVRASLAALLLAMTVVPTALAQSLTITTPFPAVVADPGGTAEFDVTITTETPERVDLSIASQPEGWETALRGGGSTVSAVTTGPNAEQAGQINALVTAAVTIPEDAAAGSYQVVIDARSAAGLTAQLTLDLTIDEQVGGAIVLESDFPTQGGSTDETFEFDLELRNESNQEVELAFEADPPAGWRATARPGTGETGATTLILEAGGVSSVNVTVDPPPDAPVGVYNIPVRALGGPQPAEAEVSVEITGSFDMVFTTSDQRLSAQATVGTPTTLTVTILNSGTAPLDELELSATPPRNWEVAFASDTVAEVLPGQTQNVDVTITPAPNAVAGDYVVTLQARNAEVNESIEIRTTVETSPIGGLIGIGVLIVVAAGLLFVFQRYGRR